MRVRCLTQDDTTIALPSRPQHPQFFAAFKVTFLILQVCFKPTVAHNCHGNNKYLTAIINTSRQNQKCRGEIKFPVSAPQFEQNILELMWTQPQQPLRAQLVPRTHGYNSFLWFWFCRELFAFAARFLICRKLFGFAVSILVLL